MPNKYYFRSHISDRLFRLVLKMFCLDLPATQAAEFANLNRVTVNNIYTKIRDSVPKGVSNYMLQN